MHRQRILTRSFSMSAPRASSNEAIDSLMPSLPDASTPYGSLPDVDAPLSSETRSASSL